MQRLAIRNKSEQVWLETNTGNRGDLEKPGSKTLGLSTVSRQNPEWEVPSHEWFFTEFLKTRNSKKGMRLCVCACVCAYVCVGGVKNTGFISAL